MTNEFLKYLNFKQPQHPLKISQKLAKYSNHLATISDSLGQNFKAAFTPRKLDNKARQLKQGKAPLKD